MSKKEIVLKKDKKLMKLIITLLCLVIFSISIISVALGDTYYVQPDNCMIVGNDSYCGEWPNENDNVELDWGETWKFDEMNINVTAPEYPYIDEELSLGFTEQKTWHDYNLTVICADIDYMNATLKVGDNLTDDKHKIKITCGDGQTAVQDIIVGEKDMKPGESWFGIRCLPIRDSIHGKIDLSLNTSFDKVWNFTDEQGTCSIELNPSNLYMEQLEFADKYSDCQSKYNNCKTDLSEGEKDVSTYKSIVTVIGIAIAVMVLLFFKDNRGGHIMSFFKDPSLIMPKLRREKLRELKNEKTDLRNIPVIDEQEKAKRLEEYKRKYDLR